MMLICNAYNDTRVLLRLWDCLDNLSKISYVHQLCSESWVTKKALQVHQVLETLQALLLAHARVEGGRVPQQR